MIIKRKLFSLNGEYIKELLITSKPEISSLRRHGYPKFYVDYLEKVNPIIYKELGSEDPFAFPFAINLEISEIDNFTDEFETVKNGKSYIPCFSTDIWELKGFAMYYLGDDNKFYERKGVFFPKFIEVKNIKEDLLNEIVNSGDYWDGPEMPSGIKKIVDAIKRL